MSKSEQALGKKLNNSGDIVTKRQRDGVPSADDDTSPQTNIDLGAGSARRLGYFVVVVVVVIVVVICLEDHRSPTSFLTPQKGSTP
jgi:hypothetical protein